MHLLVVGVDFVAVVVWFGTCWDYTLAVVVVLVLEQEQSCPKSLRVLMVQERLYHFQNPADLNLQLRQELVLDEHQTNLASLPVVQLLEQELVH